MEGVIGLRGYRLLDLLRAYLIATFASRVMYHIAHILHAGRMTNRPMGRFAKIRIYLPETQSISSIFLAFDSFDLVKRNFILCPIIGLLW
jgi:hypothetical protein